MKHRVFAASLVVAVVTPGVFAQTLQQRIDEVRRKQQLERQRDEAQPRWEFLQALLYKKLSVDFDKTPARDAFDFLQTALDVNLIARYSDDLVGHGIDPALPITLSVDDMQALEVLELVLEQCSVVEQCAWQVRKGFLEVGTKERLSVPAAREVRWYPIDELIFEAPKFDDAFSLRLDQAFTWYGGSGYGYSGGFVGGGYGGGMQFSTATGSTGSGGSGGAGRPGVASKSQRVQSLMNLIMDMVEPGAWTAAGGDWATMHYRDGMLIVSAPEFIQRQIFGTPKIPPPDPK